MPLAAQGDKRSVWETSRPQERLTLQEYLSLVLMRSAEFKRNRQAPQLTFGSTITDGDFLRAV